MAHGTMDVIHVELPSAALGTAVTLDAPVWHLALSPDGRFSVATTQQKAYLFQDGALVRTQAIPADYISSADISEEGVAVLGTQNGDGSTKLVGMTVAGTGTFAITRPSKDRRGLHPLVRFAPGGRAFLTSERDGASRFNLTFTP